MNKIKKGFCITLSCLLVLSIINPISIFGQTINSIDVSNNQANQIASQIEDIDDNLDNEIIVQDAIETRNDYNISLENAEASIPKDASEEIVLEIENSDDTVEISLPETAKKMKSELAEDGTVFYDSRKSDVSFAVQAINEEVNGVNLAGIRQLIIIDNKNAPKEYAFGFDVEDGSSIVKLSDVPGMITDDKSNAYCLLNKEGEVVLELDAPWAQDSNGEFLNTYYKVSGNKVIQIVDFDENSAFPIYADPKATTAKVVTVKSSPIIKRVGGCPKGQPSNGYSLPKGSQLYISTGTGQTYNTNLSFSVPGIKGISVSFSYNLGTCMRNYSVNGFSLVIPSKKYRYKAYVTIDYKCIPWVTYRQLKNGKQITDKGVMKSFYTSSAWLSVC